MELDRVLKALGEPMRLKIYQNLLERKHCVRSLSKKLGISESAISQHMKVMRDADLIYAKNTDTTHTICPCRKRLTRFWKFLCRCRSSLLI